LFRSSAFDNTRLTRQRGITKMLCFSPKGNRTSARSAITQFRENIIATSRHLSSPPALFIRTPPSPFLGHRQEKYCRLRYSRSELGERSEMAFLIRASLSRQLHRESPNKCPPRHAPIWLARILSRIDADQVQVSTCTRLHANPHPRAFFFASSRRANGPLGRSLSSFSSRKFARRELLSVPGKSSLDQFVRRSRISRKVPITCDC